MAGFFFSSSNLSAQTSEWDYGNGSFWNSISSWQSGGIPDANDEALFNTSAPTTALLLGNRQAGAMSVSAGDVTMQTSSFSGTQRSLTLNNNGNSLSVLGAGTSLALSGARINVQSNSSNAVTVGDSATLALNGVNSFDTRLSVAGWIDVGNSAGGTLEIFNGSAVDSLVGHVGFGLGSSGIATIDGFDSRWDSGNALWVGGSGSGAVNVLNGGTTESNFAYVGIGAASSGDVSVTGLGSVWRATEQLDARSGANIFVDSQGTLAVGNAIVPGVGGGIYVSNTGSSIQGLMQLANGATLNNQGTAIIGGESNSFGTVDVEGGSLGTGFSNWSNAKNLSVGLSGTGTLNINSGASVTNVDGFVGHRLNSTGTVTVNGSGSNWTNSGDMHLGELGGNGTLNIQDNGLVTVLGTTTIGGAGSVNLDGGRFEFGTMSLSEFSGINANSGAMAGNVDHSGYSAVAAINNIQASAVDITEVNVRNSGVLYGDANLGITISNTASGQLEVVAGERMRFAGSATNAGEINNFGGLYRFAGEVTNQSGGFISGRGQFIADGGWANDGVIATSGGYADIHGDLVNSANGIIAIGGGSVTTFYDDVTMDALNPNIDVSEDSTAVFFGSFNGGNDGLGTVHAFGDLRPGNSPGVVSFGGDLEMGSSTYSFFEIAGTDVGEFDQLQVAGDLKLDGYLDVSLLGGFDLGSGAYEFFIANVSGDLNGKFTNFGEGDLVGTFSGRNLFISYEAGDGNDVALFTSIPEPGSAALLVIAAIGCSLRRRRKNFS